MAMNISRIQKGWDVYGSDGSKIGTVDEVGSNYVVVRKGFILHKDIYVPESALEGTAQDRVTLNVAKHQVDDMHWDQPPPDTHTAETTGAMTPEEESRYQPGSGDQSTASGTQTVEPQTEGTGSTEGYSAEQTSYKPATEQTETEPLSSEATDTSVQQDTTETRESSAQQQAGTPYIQPETAQSQEFMSSESQTGTSGTSYTGPADREISSEETETGISDTSYMESERRGLPSEENRESTTESTYAPGRQDTDSGTQASTTDTGYSETEDTEGQGRRPTGYTGVDRVAKGMEDTSDDTGSSSDVGNIDTEDKAMNESRAGTSETAPTEDRETSSTGFGDTTAQGPAETGYPDAESQGLTSDESEGSGSGYSSSGSSASAAYEDQSGSGIRDFTEEGTEAEKVDTDYPAGERQYPEPNETQRGYPPTSEGSSQTDYSSQSGTGGSGSTEEGRTSYGSSETNEFGHAGTGGSSYAPGGYTSPSAQPESTGTEPTGDPGRGSSGDQTSWEMTRGEDAGSYGQRITDQPEQSASSQPDDPTSDTEGLLLPPEGDTSGPSSSTGESSSSYRSDEEQQIRDRPYNEEDERNR